MEVSVIIPVYNAANDIDRCLKSIKKQTYKNCEYIFINDGSKDHSAEVINEFILENKELKVRLINQDNVGVAITRNRGIQEASGIYIMFVDNDDFLSNDYVEVFVNEIKKSEADIVLGGYERITNEKVLFSKSIGKDDYTKYVITAPWAKIYRKEFLLYNNIEFLNYSIGEDVYFNIMAYQLASVISYVDYIGYHWYFNDQSVSNTSQKGFQKDTDILFLLDKLFCLPIKNEEKEYLHYFFIRYIVWYLLFSGKSASPKEFRDEYKRVYPWLKQHAIKTKFHFFSKKIAADTITVRISVSLFRMLSKCRLITLFSLLYCRG